MTFTEFDRSTWTKRAVYAVMSGMVTLALAVLLGMVFKTWYNDPPLRVHSIDDPYTEPLCPGDTVIVRNRIEVNAPVLLYSYFSVMNKDQTYNIDGTQSNSPPIPQPRASTFIQAIPWTVPDLPAGEYTRVQSFRSTDGRQNSLFLVKIFEVGANCND